VSAGVVDARTVPVTNALAVRSDGLEIGLDTYAVSSATDLLIQVALERMRAGVATRRLVLVWARLADTRGHT
jgi:hypothetical protein